MPAAAVRREKISSQIPTKRSSATVRQRKTRSPQGKFSKLIKWVFLALTLAMMFGYVSVYANVTVEGFSRSKLLAELKQEKIVNERLRVRWNSLCSPDKVVKAAGNSGMVYATQYDYIREPSKLASAQKPSDD